MQQDLRGNAVSQGSAAALADFETALVQFQTYFGDAVATIDARLAQEPGFTMGHLLRGLALVTAAERRFNDEAARSLTLAAVQASRANARERGLMRALQLFTEGDLDAGCRALDRVLVEHPRDALALQAAHLGDFLRGDAVNLRNRVARVLPHWSPSVPGYSYVLGMHAFGLEECNQFAAAEETGRRALEIEPRDPWSIHAVAHVMEMQGRIDEGVGFLESRENDWLPDNGFSYHNAWHLALFYLDGARHDRVLALYDRTIHPGPAPTLMALVDATAMLWRLHLEGVDVGGRFEQVADEWEAAFDRETGFYAFNDFHAALAFAATGRVAALRHLVTRLEAATLRIGSNAAMTRHVGLPLVLALQDIANHNDAGALEPLLQVRDVAQRFGGSNAQRDLLSLTLIETATRAGDYALARHLVAERDAAKPEGAWGRRLGQRVTDAERHAAALAA